MDKKPAKFTVSEMLAAVILSGAFAVVIGIIITLNAVIGCITLTLCTFPLLLAVYDYDRIVGDPDDGE